MKDVAYTWSPLAALYFGAALVVLGFGAAILLYEHFSGPSRRFFLVTVVIAAWLPPLGMAILAQPGEGTRLWLRVAFLFDPFSAPAAHLVATTLAGVRRRRRQQTFWAVAAGFSALSSAGPWLVVGLESFTRSHALTRFGWLGALYFGWIATVIGLAVWELWTAQRHAATRDERRELHVLALAGILGFGALADYWLPTAVYRAGVLTPVSLATAALLVSLVAGRWRVFSLLHASGADEVLRTMSEAVLVADSAGRVRGANPAAGRLLGRRHASLTGARVDELMATGVSEDRLHPWLPSADDTVQNERLWMLPPGKTPVAVSVSTRQLRFRRRPVATLIVARDVRDRLRSDQALAAAEMRFRSLVEHSPAVVYEFSPEGRILRLNPVARDLFGAEPAEFLGRSFDDVIDPEERERAWGIFGEVLRGAAREYEMGLVTPRGPRWIRGVSIPVLDEGNVVSVLGVALDMTEEIEARQQAEIQRRYFAELFESSPEAVALTDADGAVLRVNGEFTRMFGHSREEAVGHRLAALIVPPDLQDESVQLTRMALTGGVARAETVRQRKLGGRVDVSLLARQIRIGGEPPQLYVLYRDITERRAAERRIWEREEELRHGQKLEAVGKLAGGIAHDFNNLLTVINGQARFLLGDLDPDSPLRAELEEIERAGARAASLTQQLLAFSRRQVLRPQAVDVHAVIGELERMLGRLIGEHIHRSTRLLAADARVFVDRGQLEQVLVNLVVNARDAMPDGGTLTLRTQNFDLSDGDDEVESWGVEPGRFLSVAVEDTGTGMDPDTLERIFEPFYTTKERGKGLGLGLSTVFGIVKQSGGHVVATSEPGGGSRIAVLLPVAETAEGSAPEPPASPGSACPAPATTVLVVEDEPAVRRLAVRVLERAGYTVLDAANGVDGLRVFQGHADEIHVVVTDLVMPELGGHGLAAALRELRPGLPVLFMSGYDDDDRAGGGDMEDALFLAKPFTPAALVDAVAAAVARKAKE